MRNLFSIAAAMIAGLILTRPFKKLRLPNVTAYLVAGLLIGPFCLKLVPAEEVEALSVFSTIALGFIAFSIGAEFKLDHIRAIGKSVITITVCQALGAALLVDAVLLLVGVEAPMALVLGAIATATAPAATLMVVRQYHAQGELTGTLLPVVAMDDAIGLMVYSVSVAVADMLAGGAAFSFVDTILRPLGEILLSLLVGGALGFLVSLSNRWFHSRVNRMSICLAAVILGVALAKRFGLSDLLLCMATGAVYVNLREDSMRTLDRLDIWTPPLFLMFFVISGAQLDVSAIPSVGLVGALYILVRSAGKYCGAWIGAKWVHASPKIRKYLGITLLPQAGVAIGMAAQALVRLPQYGSRVQAIVLCATLIYELLGPLATKIALKAAGEIPSESVPSK